MRICFYSMREFDELPMAQELSRETGIEFVHTTEYPNDSNIELARGCDAISFTPCDMSAGVLDRFAEVGVRYALCRSIGYDHVNLAHARKLGLHVDNVSYPPSAVADYTLLLTLAALRRLPHILERAQMQDYTLRGKIGRDLSQLTVGVLGTGRIGTAVIRRLSGFGCKIMAFDAYENDEAASMATYASLDEVLATSDVVTLHMNANDSNHHIIDADAIARMPQGAVVVNTARGKLVDTTALIDGIRTGHLGGAALDVLEHENGLYYYDRVGDVIDNDQLAVLKSFPNVIVSPHTAFYTDVSVRNMVKGNFDSLAAFESGEKDSGLEVLA